MGAETQSKVRMAGQAEESVNAANVFEREDKERQTDRNHESVSAEAKTLERHHADAVRSVAPDRRPRSAFCFGYSTFGLVSSARIEARRVAPPGLQQREMFVDTMHSDMVQSKPL